MGRNLGDGGGLSIATVATGTQLSSIPGLARSVARHQPGHRLGLLSLTPVPPDIAAEVEPIGLDALLLSSDDLARMAFVYPAADLAHALIPWLLRLLLDSGADHACYLAPESLLLGPVDPVLARLADAAAVLVPRRLSAVPEDGLRPDRAELDQLTRISDAFVGVAEAAQPALDWWCDQVGPHQWPPRQRPAAWLDAIPSLVETVIDRTPGVVLSAWNADEGDWHPTELSVNGQSVIVANFDRFDRARPWNLAGFAGRYRVRLSERPAVLAVLRNYVEQLGPDPWDQPEGPLDSLGGKQIPPGLRRLYAGCHAVSRTSNRPPPAPDLAAGAANLTSWFLDETDHPGMRRLAHLLWLDRIDLRRSFPDPTGADRDAYLDWLASHGVASALVPDTWDLTPSGRESLPRSPTCGIELFGYLDGQLGLGTSARLLLDAIWDSGVPVSTHVCSGHTSRAETSYREAHSDKRYPINVLAVTPGHYDDWLTQWGARYQTGAYTIGYWVWETDRLPEEWRAAVLRADEIWTVTEYSAEVFRAVTDRPVLVFPTPAPQSVAADWASTAALLPSTVSRGGYFYFSFDLLSSLVRKNPLGLLCAYRTAFGSGDGPPLVLRALNGAQCPEDHERLLQAVREVPQVILLEDYLSADLVQGLITHALAVVSLHRSEGFGLTPFEALAAGVPVIATDYSGSRHFLSAENAWLVPARVVPIGHDDITYAGRGVWAEPDLVVAARLMRAVAADPAAAAAKAARARTEALRTWTAERAADFVRDRFAEIVTSGALSHWSVRPGAP